VRHIIVVGHSNCGGVRAAMNNQRAGLVDNWLRHVQDVRDRMRPSSTACPKALRWTRCGVERAGTVAQCLPHHRGARDAWQRGQEVVVHGWVYGLHNGLLEDLRITVAAADDLQPRPTSVRWRLLQQRWRDRCRLCRRGKRLLPPSAHALNTPLEPEQTPHVPAPLTDRRAFDIAQALIEGFNRHYRLFRDTSARPSGASSMADWHGQQRAQAQRIEFYDQRVNEAVDRLQA
jgi:hypothetical protein